jgi:hypothetical protein
MAVHDWFDWFIVLLRQPSLALGILYSKRFRVLGAAN